MRQKRNGTLKKTSAKAAKLMLAEARVNRWLKVLDDVLDGYEKDNPHWRMLALLWLVEGSLGNLRKYLEAGSRTRSRWRHPFVEVRYMVNWNWSSRDKDTPAVTYGQISSSTRDSAIAKQISSIAIETIIQEALRGFTNDVALQKRGEKYLPLIPIEIAAEFRKIRSSSKRELILDELYRPFSMGAAEVDFDDEAMRAGTTLSLKTQQKFAEQSQQMDLPSITLNIKKDERSMQIVPVFQVYPLTVDVRNKTAYYPLTVGFIILPDVLPGEDPVSLLRKNWAQPGSWSATDRRVLWKEIIGGFRQVADSLKPPEATPSKEAVVTVSAKLRMKIDPSNPEQSNEAVKRMLESFGQTGVILEMSHSWGDAMTLSQSSFSLLLKQVEESSLSEKGAAFEKLVTALFASIPGFHVKANSITRTEEIDLVVINGHDDPRWKTSSPLILVECKKRSTACSKNDIVQFRAKLDNRRGQCRLGFIISINGFAETAKNELLRNSQGDVVIVMIDGEMIRQAVEKNSFLPVLQRAWDQAVIS